MKALIKLWLSIMLAIPACPAPAAADASIVVKPEYEQTVIAPDAGSVHIIIRFTAPDLPRSGPRSPVSLALVIDRSGSMSEAGKLDYAKMAARDLVNHLNEKDNLSLVVYDANVRVLQPMARVTNANRGQALRLIRGLEPSGATNLSGGMQAGFNQLAEADSAGLKRVILLSDGLANRGETVPSRIAAMAASARRKGMSVTAMGLGEDFDEDLMQLIAQRGGGNYYYIRHPEDSSRFFASELKGVMDGVSKNASLRLELSDSVRDVKIYGYTLSGQAGERLVDISDFYAGEERMMVIEYFLNPLKPGNLSLGGLHLDYESLLEPGRRDARTIRLDLEASADAARQGASVNQEAKVEVLALQADEKYAQALTEAGRGNFEEAGRLVSAAKAELSRNPLTASSEVLKNREQAMQVEESRISSIAAAPQAERQDMIKQGRSRVYNASQGKTNMQFMRGGSRGLEVELLQQALAKLGLYQGPIDGNYSQEVENAVKSFQSANGLDADGVAGPATQNALGQY